MIYADKDVALAVPGNRFSQEMVGDRVSIMSDRSLLGLTPKFQAQGEIFRVRDEHVVIKIIEGTCSKGDLVKYDGPMRVSFDPSSKLTKFPRKTIELLKDASYSKINRQVGDLFVMGAFRQLSPNPDAIAFDELGRLLVEVRGGRFIQDGTRLIEQDTKEELTPVRSADFYSRDTKLNLSVMTMSESKRGGMYAGLERAVIKQGSTVLYASSYHPQIKAVAVHGNMLAILRGNTIDILKWKPYDSGSN